jgi:hypothetical protein
MLPQWVQSSSAGCVWTATALERSEGLSQSKPALRRKIKMLFFLQNEPEKLFRINKTPLKSAKTNRKMARKAEKCRLAKLPEMSNITFCPKERTGTNRKKRTGGGPDLVPFEVRGFFAGNTATSHDQTEPSPPLRAI